MNGKHHLQLRKRKSINLETFPHPDRLKQTVDRLAYLSILLPIMTIPQLVVIFSSQNASGLSVLTWSTYLIGAMFWTFYGILHKEKQIIFPNFLMSIIQVGIIIGILLYG